MKVMNKIENIFITMCYKNLFDINQAKLQNGRSKIGKNIIKATQIQEITRNWKFSNNKF